MKVKVCGLNDSKNIGQLKGLGLDFMGFIFYERSKRSIYHGDFSLELVNSLSGVKKVGVFVDSPLDVIFEAAKHYQLDYIQLHGAESPEYCLNVKAKGLKVIKAISISNELPTEYLKTYEACIDLFLLDTSGKDKGGNGIKFNWEILEDYRLEIPFMLAGGISLDDAVEIKGLNIKELYGVDLNSKFELEPGLKDINKVKQFIEEIK